MTDLLGPSTSAANFVTADPGDTRVFGASDTFYKDCTPGNQDGTAIGASWLNGILKQLRGAIRGMGITVDNTDGNMLLKAMVNAGVPYAADTGIANALIVDVAQPGFALAAGKSIIVKVVASVTGAATIHVFNGAADLGTKNIVRGDGTALNPGDLVAGQVAPLSYDGTQFQLLTTQAQFGGFGTVATLASAATTDLGTIPSHNVSISGTTTITSFGSSASTIYPFYRIIFTGALTLTHNGASLILPGAASILTAAGDSAFAAYLGGGNWRVLFYQRAASQPYRQLAPTVQNLTSGSGATYTTPAGCTYIKVRAVGGGAAGGGGSAGNDTTFNSIVAKGGSAGVAHSGTSGGAGGAGGTGGTGTATLRLPGAAGGDGGNGTGSAAAPGGNGGGSVFGGAGAPSAHSGATNSGSGGAGAGSGGAGGAGGDGGGGAGEYFELIIGSPAATYTYTVGAAAGTGAAGRIVVEEYYN
jgi:hypothetical protein